MIANQLYRFIDRFVTLFLLFTAVFVSNSFAQTPEQVKFYSERIEFGSEDVKRNALYDLRNFKTESASRIALPALKDSSEIIRTTATHSVIYLPKEESAKNLIPLLSDQSEFIRKEAVYALGKTRNPNVAINLIRILRKDRKREVRDAAAVSLGLLGNLLAIKPLTAILSKKPKKKQKFYRRAAARSIGQIVELVQKQNLTFATPQDFLPNEYKKIEKAKYLELTQRSEFRIVVSVLIKSLQNKKEFSDVKREAAFTLGAIGNSSAIQALKDNLDSEDYYLAEICKEALLRIQQ